MIFVALGTQKFQLNRLLKLIDSLIETKQIKDEVFAQIGNSDYHPVNYKYSDFLNPKDFEEYISKCDLLITHSGVGTIVCGLKNKKPVIVFPRLAKFCEHVDDHQLQIAEAFSSQNYVLLCGENDNLSDLIKMSYSHIFSVYKSNRKVMIDELRGYIKSLK